MNRTGSLKFLMIGLTSNKKVFAIYPNQEEILQLNKTCIKIFERVCKDESILYEERNRIEDDEKVGYYYFTTTLGGVFYIAFADRYYPDILINNLFEELKREGLTFTATSRGTITKSGMDKLKNLFESFRIPELASPLNAAKLEINEVRKEMRSNVNNIIGNLDDIKTLQDKSKGIHEGSKVFSKDAKELERLTWWRNCKWTVILVLVIIVVLLIIILPLVLKKSDPKINAPRSSPNTIPSASK